MMQNTCRCSTVFFPALIALLLVSLIRGCEQPASPLSPAISASPSSFNFSAEQGAANPSSQTLQIQNSGGGTLAWSATDDADWLTLSLANASSAAEANEVTISVNIAGLSPGHYSATITISAPEASNSPQEVPVSLTITPIIPTAGYYVSVSASPLSQTGLPGHTLDYTITITNRGTEADTYDLSITSHQDWALTAPSTTSEIASVASESITLSLTIPQNAAAQTEDQITIIATSQSDPAASDSATCTAVVVMEEEQPEEQPPSITPPASLSISPSSTTKSPGDTFAITILVDAAAYDLMGIDVEVGYDSDAMTTSEAQITGNNLLGDMEIGPTITDGEV
ncbi:MAG: hypothetical protein KAT75_00050, partial [Dehalococcoidia bacterium]|nr:hypothetical protein [Dehalococcoidia bacterium]